MNLRDLQYILAVAEHRHFGRAAEACHISQPTLSTQVKKLEETLGVVLFERTKKWVQPTEVGQAVLAEARRALDAADGMMAIAQAARDPFSGPLRLGVIPTLGPYLMPLAYAPLRQAFPVLTIDPWEDVTEGLLERLRQRQIDAALIATEAPEGNFATIPLFVEPFLAALPAGHPLAREERVREEALGNDLLVLADGHCMRGQTIAACGRTGPNAEAFRAAGLQTLIHMVAAGYGTTLIPGLAAGAVKGLDVVLRPLAGGARREVAIVARASFPRMAVLEGVARVIRGVVAEVL